MSKLYETIKNPYYTKYTSLYAALRAKYVELFGQRQWDDLVSTYDSDEDIMLRIAINHMTAK